MLDDDQTKASVSSVYLNLRNNFLVLSHRNTFDEPLGLISVSAHQTHFLLQLAARPASELLFSDLQSIQLSAARPPSDLVPVQEPCDDPSEGARSVQLFLGGFLFERHLGAHGALHGSLHQPGGQVDGEEGAACRPQPVPPEPALRLHGGWGGRSTLTLLYLQMFMIIIIITSALICH